MKWLLAALGLSALLAGLERVFLKFFLYWRYPWSDTGMHFLGGLAVGTFAIGLLQGRWQPRKYILLALCAALGWEFLKYTWGGPRAGNFVLDSASDLLFDALGLLIPYVIARTTIWRSA